MQTSTGLESMRGTASLIGEEAKQTEKGRGIGCTEAAVDGTLTDTAAAQGTLTDLHTKAETGNEVTEIAETGIEADRVTDNT